MRHVDMLVAAENKLFRYACLRSGARLTSLEIGAVRVEQSSFK